VLDNELDDDERTVETEELVDCEDVLDNELDDDEDVDVLLSVAKYIPTPETKIITMIATIAIPRLIALRLDTISTV